jgi:hypothetical protein
MIMKKDTWWVTREYERSNKGGMMVDTITWGVIRIVLEVLIIPTLLITVKSVIAVKGGMEKGYCPEHQKTAFASIYEDYHDLGRNGVADCLYDEVMALPFQPPNQKKGVVNE